MRRGAYVLAYALFGCVVTATQGRWEVFALSASVASVAAVVWGGGGVLPSAPR